MVFGEEDYCIGRTSLRERNARKGYYILEGETVFEVMIIDTWADACAAAAICSPIDGSCRVPLYAWGRIGELKLRR